MQATLLGLDVGTTVTKAVLFDLEGHELTFAEKSYPLITPQPGWVELNPQAIWQAVLDVIKTVTSQQPEGSLIMGIGLSTQGGTLILADGEGKPIYNAITWLDQRAAPLISEWQDQHLDQWIRGISGWSPQPGLPLASLCAMRIEQPEIFSKIRIIFSINDFLVFHLTGARCTNPSMAGEMLLANCGHGDYSPELCEFTGIQVGMLSPIKPANTICGPINPELCLELGLQPGTPLINGGQDHACEALALGLMGSGDTYVACGTAWVNNTVSESTGIDSFPQDLALNPHVIPDRWIISKYLGSFGAGFSWWLDNFWDAHMPTDERYAAFDRAVTTGNQADTGIIYLPVSGLPRTGQLVGGFWGLRLDHDQADMGRAVLESAAFELRLALQQLEQLGLPCAKLWMVGGASRSQVWPQILADICQVPILLTQYRHGSALGGSILAGTALGLLDNTEHWVIPQRIEPQPDEAVRYQQKLDAYLKFLEEMPI